MADFSSSLAWCKTHHKQTISMSAIIVAVVLLMFPAPRVPVVDTIADEYFTESVALTASVYATCRVVNRVVSVGKDASIELTPFGVGIAIPIGEMLDPIDDMTERLANILVTALTSLATQKVFYEVSYTLAPLLVAYCLFVVGLLVWIPHNIAQRVCAVTVQVIVLVLVCRLFLPVSATMNETIQTSFFDARISAAQSELEPNIDALKAIEIYEYMPKWSDATYDGLWGPVEFVGDYIVFTFSYITKIIDVIMLFGKQTLAITAPLLELSKLYVAQTVIQIIVLPIASFYVMMKLVNALFQTRLPVIVKDPLSQNKPD